MQARNQQYTLATRAHIDELARLGWYHSIELPDGSLIKGHQSIDRLQWRLRRFPVPPDLSGKRVLDIGAWDGWFSFEMERRGAEVVAVDLTVKERFLTAKRLLRSNVEYVISDIQQLSPERLGRFDIVLFLGVLYHTKHPLLALERVCDLCTDMAFIESYVTDDGSDPSAPPAMEFYETTELRGQFDNWVGPNTSCLLALCRTAGFPRVELADVTDSRASVTCHRTWPDVPRCSGSAPYVTCVENSVTRDHDFSTSRDDYVAVWFESDARDLACGNVFPRVGSFGSRPVIVANTGGDGWHANFKLPLGLSPGWHEVALRANSAWSNGVRIPIDVPPDQQRSAGGVRADLTIEIIADGKTWRRNTVYIRPGSCISLWVRGLPDGTDKSEVCVRLDGVDLPAVFVSTPGPDGLIQVNALLPASMKAGEYSLSLGYLDYESSSRKISLVSETS